MPTSRKPLFSIKTDRMQKEHNQQLKAIHAKAVESHHLSDEELQSEHERCRQRALIEMLSITDHRCSKQLEIMSRLKEGMNLRSYQQEDPIRLYEREGLELFTNQYHELQKEVARLPGKLISEISAKEES